jgi:hypothetical protein
VTADEETLVLVAPDGSRAECSVPFPPLQWGSDPVDDLVAHAEQERQVGVVLVRLGGHAAGVFEGERLVRSAVGRRHVQGRSAAGGWSQQRFARRRAAQGRVAFAAAADACAEVLLPVAGTLAAVVTGGDRRALDQVLADPRLAPLRALVTGQVLDVPDPRRTVLEQTPRRFRAIRIRVVDGEGNREADSEPDGGTG